MPIAKLSPEAPPPSKPTLPVTETVTSQTVAIRNDKTPIQSLQAYLDGLPWTVTYYAQLLTSDNELKELDPQLSAVYQQYQKTIDLELRVQSSLQASHDSETQITNVTGSALISHLNPNKNDYFIAEASLQQRGLFVVTNVERRTHRQGSVYLVDYVLVGYLDTEQARYTNLESKVVRKYHFSKTRLVDGLAPMLKEEVHSVLEMIEQSYFEILSSYFAHYFNRTHMTLVVPGQAGSVYDVWLVNFLAAITETQDVEAWRDMRVLSLDNDRYIQQGGLWKALLSRIPNDLKTIHQKAGVASKSVFNESSWLHGPRYWSIDSYVYPAVESDPTRLGTDRPIPIFSLNDLSSQEEGVFKSVTVGDQSIPLIKPVLADDYYVLSEAFYTGEGVLSGLEVLMRDYLHGRTLDLDLISELIDDYVNWPVLEQFYYGPMLVLLCKEAPRGFYK